MSEKASNYDKIVLKLLPERFLQEKKSVYEQLLNICHYISLLTDGKAMELYKMING